MDSENLADMSEFILKTDSPVNNLFLQDGCLEDFITADGEDLSLLELEPYQKNKVTMDYSVIQQSQEMLLETSVIAKPETVKHDSTQYQQVQEFRFEESEPYVETQQLSDPHNKSLANPNWGNSFVETFENLSVNNVAEGSCLSPEVPNNGAEQYGAKISRKRGNQQDIHEILNEIKELETLEHTPELDRDDIRHKVKRKKNTVACRKSRQKKKEQEEAKTRKIEELEQKMKQMEEDTARKVETMKKQFGIIVQAMLQAGTEHISTDAKSFIFTQWSKVNII